MTKRNHRSFKKIYTSLSLLVLFFLLIAATETPQRIVVIGDSTVSFYRLSRYYPQMGWGQVLNLYFSANNVLVEDMAAAGRSSRSFIEDGHWASVKSSLQSGDILLIQFGHNDRDWNKEERYTSPEDYKTYLTQYVNEARALNVYPVFVTPMNMNTWTGSTVREVFCESSSNYRGAMIEVGQRLNVPVLDLEKQSKALMDTMGADYMKSFHFLGLEAGEYDLWPNGSSDGTHFQETGAMENARMVVEEMKKHTEDSVLKTLISYAVPLYTVQVLNNNSRAGLVSKTRSFPAGATVTLKVKPNGSANFKGWMDANGTQTQNTRLEFTQPAHNTQWQAVWEGTDPLPMEKPKDCAGVEEDKAYLDSCGRCVGGTTGITPCQSFLELEENCHMDGVLETIHLGYTGSGYVNLDNHDSSQLNIALNLDQETTTDSLFIRYANGSTQARTMDLYVDSVWHATLNFTSDNNWDNWQTEGFTLSLTQGWHLIELVSQTAEGAPNLDGVYTLSNHYSSASCEEPLHLNPSDFASSQSIGPSTIRVYDSKGRFLGQANSEKKQRTDSWIIKHLVQQ